MKRIITSVALLLSGFVGFAQQDAQFTQNMFNKLSVNPGFAGANGGVCGVLLYRAQWMGFNGNPTTGTFSGDIAFNFLGAQHGAGLTVWQDHLGIETTSNFKLAYAYRRTLGPGDIGIGIEGGLISKSLKPEWVAVDDYTLDASIPDNGASDNTFDFGAGLYYQIKNKLYVGLSATHIPQGTFEQAAQSGSFDGLRYNLARHYYVMAGYYYDVNPQWQLQPSIFIKSDGASTQLDLNVLALYNNSIWGGVSYRMQDAIAVMAGYNFGGISSNLDGLKLGIAYDYTTSKLGKYTSGSLEVMLKYCKPISSTPKVLKYHSVRFL
ncbi:MAG TPA: hypothetical protein DIU39_10650 [Flavobacteriales bacterium]|nr:hypothetical protein [Flavobacteriales bacterium]|tara:strand:- start:68665 stop:69630 length:966 start_codon:yes stop_codon:yes gene_type:complete